MPAVRKPRRRPKTPPAPAVPLRVGQLLFAWALIATLAAGATYWQLRLDAMAHAEAIEALELNHRLQASLVWQQCQELDRRRAKERPGEGGSSL